MHVKIIVARRQWLRLLNVCGIDAVAMPWMTVYVRPGEMGNLGLIRHELVHVEQIRRDGPVLFSVKYLWWLVRYGYRANPYEIEAYTREPIE